MLYIFQIAFSSLGTNPTWLSDRATTKDDVAFQSLDWISNTITLFIVKTSILVPWQSWQLTCAGVSPAAVETEDGGDGDHQQEAHTAGTQDDDHLQPWHGLQGLQYWHRDGGNFPTAPDWDICCRNESSRSGQLQSAHSNSSYLLEEGTRLLCRIGHTLHTAHFTSNMCHQDPFY